VPDLNQWVMRVGLNHGGSTIRRMPPKKKKEEPIIVISQGTGMIAGLELCRQADKFILTDHSPDGRFANDVRQWNDAAVSLNSPTTKKNKDAKK
jgi:hypothetical protein